MTNPPLRRSGETDTNQGWVTAAEGMADVLRRGAWYPILEETPDGIVIEVDQQRLLLARDEVRRRPDKPTEWSVVVRTGVMRPTLAGPKLVTTYAVCPDCTGRQEFEGKPASMMCVRCRRAAKVDWSTTY